MAHPLHPLRDGANAALRHLPSWAVYAAAFLTTTGLVGAAAMGGLGPDPIDALTEITGQWTVWLVVVGLWMGPAQKLVGLRLVRLRRAVGLSAFLFALLHVATWVALDQGLDVARMASEIAKRPFLAIGAAAFVAFLPLAATSWNGAIRRMGPLRWRQLHLLVHPLAVLALAHWGIGSKVWDPMITWAIALVVASWAVRWWPDLWPRAQAS
jgi:methionine sulfoxide reductase heme-binding subunit